MNSLKVSATRSPVRMWAYSLILATGVAAAAGSGDPQSKVVGGPELRFEVRGGGIVDSDLHVPQAPTTRVATYTLAGQTFSTALDRGIQYYSRVMCFANGAGNFDLDLTDRNGYERTISGFSDLNYSIPGLRHELVGGGPRCLGLSATVVDMENLADVTPGTFCASGGSQPAGSNPELIMRSSFEAGEGNDPSGSSADVRLAVDLKAAPNPNAGNGPLRYDIYAFNCGAEPASVTVEDFATVNNPGANIVREAGRGEFDDSPTFAGCQTPLGGSCSNGQVPGAQGGSLPYVRVTASLPAGAYVRIPVERTAIGNPGDKARLSFGLDGPDGDNLADNGFIADVTFIDNQPLSVLTSPNGTMMLDEDKPGPAVIRDDPMAEPDVDQPVPMEFNLVDADSPADDLMSLQLVEIDESGAELSPSDPGAKLAALAVSPSVAMPLATPAGPFQVLLTPKANVSGTAYVRIEAEDTGGSTRTEDREVVIREINDAPRFDVAFLDNRQSTRAIRGAKAGTEEVVIGSEYCQAQGTGGFVGIRPNCDQFYPLAEANQTVVIVNWLKAVDEGDLDAGPENDQVLEMVQADPVSPGAEIRSDLKTGALDIIDLTLLEACPEGVSECPDVILPVAGSIFRQTPQLQDFDGNGAYDLFLDFSNTPGAARLRIRVEDDGGTALEGEDTTDITVRIEVVDKVPLVADEIYQIDEDGMLVADDQDGTATGTINDDGVLANDVDQDTGDNSTLTVVSVTTVADGTVNLGGGSVVVTPNGSAGGTVTIAADGTFDYTPGADSYGTASFDYEVSDGVNDTVGGTASIAVDAVPDAFDDAFSVDEDNSVAGNVTADNGNGADDLEDTPATVQLVTGPTNALIFNLNTNGAFSYTPQANFDQSDGFTYRILDANGDLSAPATVTITVNAINDLPVIVTNQGLTVAQGATGTITAAELEASDVESPDADTDFVVQTQFGGLQRGRLEFSTNPGVAITRFSMQDVRDGIVRYVHTAGNAQDDFFAFRVVDGDGGQNLSGATFFSIVVGTVD